MATLGEIEAASLSANTDLQSQLATTEKALANMDVSGWGAGKATAELATATANDTFELNDIIAALTANQEYDFVGINTNGKEAMTAAIQTYCDLVNESIDQISTVDMTTTFKGDYSGAISELVNGIKTSCKATVLGLTAFKKDLTAVITAMEAKDTNVQTNVNTEAESLVGTVSEEANSMINGSSEANSANTTYGGNTSSIPEVN